MTDVLRQHLQDLAKVLSSAGERRLASRVRAAGRGSEHELRAFLASNELWGGPGSVADQAGVNLPRERVRTIESALIALGEAQMEADILNPRTPMWVSVFREWRQRGI